MDHFKQYAKHVGQFMSVVTIIKTCFDHVGQFIIYAMGQLIICSMGHIIKTCFVIVIGL